jgi:hypothetical protein
LAVLEQNLPQEFDSKEEIKELETTIDDSMDSNERLTKPKEMREYSKK